LKTIGLDVQPPKKTCNDPRCPFHGSLKVRGRSFTGRVVSAKAKSMVVVEREYTHYATKFMRYEKRRSTIHAHLPACMDANQGDRLTIAECRPIAKSIAFVVVGKES
jgi:small subunit ribosomal protein S17